MRTPRQPFSWDGDDESPVPPDELLDLAPRIVDEAQAVVLEAQDAIAREDTDPFIAVTAPQAAHPTIGWFPPLRRPIPKKALIACLLMACALAFAHGWAVGSSTPLATSRTCDPDHCSSSNLSSEWREEQRP